MQADEPSDHEPSLLLMNCGDGFGPRARAVVWAWVTYGLGSENQNPPGSSPLPRRLSVIIATQNSARLAFLPGAYQGTYVDPAQADVRKLIENIRNDHLPPDQQRKQLDLARRLSEMHLEKHPHDPQLEPRIQSFELAYRMQSEATDAFDVSGEPEAIRKEYGEHTAGRQLLIARRLVERGVRFVQVWAGAGQPWDNHEDLEKHHRALGQSLDGPIAAFLGDLKRRGLLETTLLGLRRRVQWTPGHRYRGCYSNLNGRCSAPTTASRCGWPAAA